MAPPRWGVIAPAGEVPIIVGINVSASEIAQVMGGMQTFVEQQKIRYYNATGQVSYAAGYNGLKNAGIAMRQQYSFGDAKAKAQLASLLSGQSKLTVGAFASANTLGQTTLNGGVRTVHLASLGQAGNLKSELLAGIVLQHEAYRNGVNNGALGQLAETTAAVFGHTAMALRMKYSVYGKIVSSMIANNVAGLGNDVNAFNKFAAGGGLAAYANYVGNHYSSTKDFWKVILHKNGGATMVNDHSNNVTIVNGEGKQIVAKYTGGSHTGFIARTLGMTKQEVNQLMGPGAGYTFNTATGKFDLQKGYSGVVHFSSKQAEEISQKFAGAQSGGASTSSGSPASGGILNTISNIWSAGSSFVDKLLSSLRGPSNSSSTAVATQATENQVKTAGTVVSHSFQSISQLQLGKMSGITANEACLATVWADAYGNANPEARLQQFASLVKVAVQQGDVTASNSWVDRNMGLSQVFAHALLAGTLHAGSYLSYVYKNGQQVVYKTESQWQQSKYPYAFRQLQNSYGKSHYMLYVNQSNTYEDPWQPQGIYSLPLWRTGVKTVSYIPLQWLSEK